MKKPIDIPKRNIFEVPEGYFEKLPGVIQARIAKKEDQAAWNWSWGISLRYAIPIAILAIVGTFWFRPGSPIPVDVQAELAQFQPEQLQEYLDHQDLSDDSDVSTDELVESKEWSNSEVDGLEKSVYSGYSTSRQEVEKILDEYDNEL